MLCLIFIKHKKIKSSTKLNQRQIYTQVHNKCLNDTKQHKNKYNCLNNCNYYVIVVLYLYCQLTFTLKITLKNEENEAKNTTRHTKFIQIHRFKNVKKLKAVNCLVWANKLICSKIKILLLSCRSCHELNDLK